LALEVVRAGKRVCEVDRLHRIELEDILGVHDGDEEMWRHFVPKLRDYVGAFMESSTGRPLQLEPIMACPYPWWTGHTTDDLLLSNQFIRTQKFMSETNRRLRTPTLDAFRAVFVRTMEGHCNSLGDVMGLQLFNDYVAETLQAHNAGETYIPLPSGAETPVIMR
jgi:hypothetical protein